MFIPVLLFIVGLILLIKGGDIFVDSAVGVARRFGLSELIIGATIVSMGTTLPEVMVSASSALSGHGEISYGNAIGSVICNTALILAITIIAKPPQVDKETLLKPVLFFFTASAFYVFNVYCFGTFSRFSGVVLLSIFILYMVLTVFGAKKSPVPYQEIKSENLRGNENIIFFKDLFFLIIGAAIIALGSDLLVDNGIEIAYALGVPESVVALTFVALGTSLPELVTALTSLVKGHGTLSLGNIVGANLLNIVFVSGLSMTLSPFDVPSSQMLFGKNASLVLDIPLMLFVMAFTTLPALIRGKIYRWQGLVLLAVYIGFCAVQFCL